MNISVSNFAMVWRCLFVSLLVLIANTFNFQQAFAADRSYLDTNEFLKTNEYLVSPNRQFVAILQSDGNFCVKRVSGHSTNSYGSDGWWVRCFMDRSPGPDQYFANLQSDGNFCVYRGSDPSKSKGLVWCRNPAGYIVPGKAPFRAALGDEGWFDITGFAPGACYGIPGDNPSSCSAHGRCIGPDTCRCGVGYSGQRCELVSCFGKQSNEPDVCSGRGICGEPDNCKCKPGFLGNECQNINCFGIPSNNMNVCSQRGKCILPNNCKCSPGYSGDECQNP